MIDSVLRRHVRTPLYRMAAVLLCCLVHDDHVVVVELYAIGNLCGAPRTKVCPASAVLHSRHNGSKEPDRPSRRAEVHNDVH